MSSVENRKRKLIFLWTYTEWGGAQMYMLTIIKQALAEWDVVVAIPKTSRKDLLDFYRPYNIPIEFLDHHFDAKDEDSIFGKLRRQFRRIRSEIGIYKYLREFDLSESVLHIEIGPWQSWILLALLSLRGGNVFITPNLFCPPHSLWRSLVWKARLQVVSRLPGLHLVASNRDVKESLKGWVSPEHWGKMSVAYSPIDVQQISEARESDTDLKAVRERFKLSEEDFIVLVVGRFSDLKGRWVLLEAAKLVLEETPDARFVWLMHSRIPEGDLHRVEGFGLEDRFVPILSRDVGADRVSILNFIRIADVFALPSFSEGLPLSLIEAMALGVPSIATDIFAIPEAIIPGETGLLVDAGNSSALAEAILRLRADPELRQRLAENGSRFAIENFDGRIMASTYLDQYDKCFVS